MARREALSAAGRLAAATLFVSATSARAQETARIIAPPSTPMEFTRTLTRNLAGGKAIVVTRTWRIAFSPIGPGYALSGTQLSAKVTAPDALDGLARLEERREESGLFPLMLGRDGLILDRGVAASQTSIERAVALVTQKLESRKIAADKAQEVRVFLRTLQSSTEQATSRLPRDLFYPRERSRMEERAITLPDGSRGEIAIGFSAETAEETGLLRRAERTVTTRIGKSSRTSSERWHLTPKEPE